MRVSVLVLLLAVSLLFLSTVKFGPVQVVASNEGPVHNLRTGNNYTSITSAIADVQTVDGDIIFVENGVYNERLYINKSLSLKGESHDNTTIDGGGNGPITQVITGSVNISNFNIQNAGTSGLSVAGIFVNGSANCVFTNLTIQNTGYGLLLLDSDGSKIENNSMLKAGEGIVALNSNSTVLMDNDVVDSQFGVALTNSTGCTLRRNHVTNCSDGFGASGSMLEQFINNVDTSNTIDGKFIYYLLNQSDLVINPSTFPNAGSITVVNSTDVVVENLTLTRGGIFEPCFHLELDREKYRGVE